jgi:hypothetical protein
MGANGLVGKTGAHLEVLILEREPGEGAKMQLLDGGGKRTPSLVNLAPTSPQTEASLEVNNYG